jgi:hypothetical protein
MKKYVESDMNMLCKKGFCPYEWMDDISKMDFVGLPPKEAFYSKLSQESISEKDYKHSQTVYEKLKCKTFRDYHMAYLKTDVLLLADVFENFRKTCFEYYGLDPSNYISSPGLAWDAMLLKTNVNLELISDLKVLDIMERCKRGGLTFVGSKRHVVANNKHMENYDQTKESNYIMYLDNFNPEKYNNPFAYFTQIIKFAFIRRIAKEKKILVIKQKALQNYAIMGMLANYQDDDSNHINSSIDLDNEYMVGLVIDFDAKRALERKKSSEKVGIEKYFFDEEVIDGEDSIDN